MFKLLSDWLVRGNTVLTEPDPVPQPRWKTIVLKIVVALETAVIIIQNALPFIKQILSI